MEAIRIPIIYEEDVSGLERASKAIETTKKATEDFNRVRQKATEETIAAYREQALEVELVAQATAELNKVNALEATLARSKKGSYNALKAEMGLITMRLNQMTAEERKTTKEGQALQKQMEALRGELKKLTDSQAPLNKTLGQTQQNLGEMRKELLALRNTSFAGKTQAEIDSINQRIGQLTDGISDLKAVQNEFGNEFGSQIAGSLQVITAGVEGVVASMNLLGIESEAMKGLQKNVIDLIAVTQALGTIEDALAKGTLKATAARIGATVAAIKDTIVKQANTVSTIAAARAEDAKAVAIARGNILVRAAAAVQWVWNAALAAFPIALVVAGVAALAAGVVYLTSVMGDGASEAERLNSQLENMRELSEQNERLRRFEIELAQERKKSNSEITALEIKQTGDRIAEKEKEIAALKRFGDLNEEQGERYKNLTSELMDLDKEKILLNERLRVALAEEADKRAKEAQERAKEARRERQRLAQEQKAEQKERQDAILRELEAQRQFDLAKLDSQRDYQNNSISYQREFEKVRFSADQAAQIEILGRQRDFGRITQKEYQAQLERLKADAAKFIAELPAITDPLGNALKRNIQAAFEGTGGDAKPLESIFDANARKDILRRANEIGGATGEELGKQTGASARNAMERFFAGESLFDILGIAAENQGQIKAQLDNAFANVLGGLSSLYDTEIEKQSQLIQARQESVNQLSAQLAEEERLRKQGVANNYGTIKDKLENETALLAKEQEKRLALERKAASLRLKQEALETASNITLSIAKVTAAEANKGLLGVITAATAIASIFALISKAKAQAAQFSEPPKLRKGGGLGELFSGVVSGKSHEFGGVDAWLHSQNMPIELEGFEFVTPKKQAIEHYDFLEDMRKGEFDGKPVQKYYDIGEMFHENPKAFSFSAPLAPDYVGMVMPDIRRTMKMQAAMQALSMSATNSAIHDLRQEVVQLRHVMEGRPIAIPLTEMGYIEKTTVGNKTSIKVCAPPKLNGQN